MCAFFYSLLEWSSFLDLFFFKLFEKYHRPLGENRSTPKNCYFEKKNKNKNFARHNFSGQVSEEQEINLVWSKNNVYKVVLHPFR